MASALRATAEAIRVAGVAESDVIAAVHADNGPGWLLLHLGTAAAVLAAQPVARVDAITNVGLVGPHGPGSDAACAIASSRCAHASRSGPPCTS